MSCGCNNNQPLPAIPASPILETSDPLRLAPCELSQPDAPMLATDPNVVAACGSEGSVLDPKFTDARALAPGEGMTLLGRVGNRLTQFIGNGFIRLVQGRAYLVESIPLVIKQFWHDLVPDGVVTRIGDPKPFPYAPVCDSQGVAHLIKGKANRRTVVVSDPVSREWVPTPTDEVPIEVSRHLPAQEELELVGFVPNSVLGSQSAIRDLKRLTGLGIVYLERRVTASVPTPEGCPSCPDDSFTYVAKVLAFPEIVASPSEETGRHRLVFSSKGLYWEPEEPSLEGGEGGGLLGNG
jgi:hypothetical protein